MSKLLETILNGIIPELQSFFGDLNWTYILMFIIILYGTTYKKEFDWWNDLVSKFSLNKWNVWITGFVIGLVFCFFRSIGPNVFDSEYISQLLRSWFCVIVFASVLIDGIVKLLKFIGTRIDDNIKK